MFYTHEEVVGIRKRIRDLDLKTVWSFDKATNALVADSSNGIGPDRWPDSLRKLVTGVLAVYGPAAVIHDWEFGPDENDGSRERWHEANSRFHVNCQKLAKASTSLWNPIGRVRALLVADALYDAVESDAGWDAWSQAFDRMGRKS